LSDILNIEQSNSETESTLFKARLCKRAGKREFWLNSAICSVAKQIIIDDQRTLFLAVSIDFPEELWYYI